MLKELVDMQSYSSVWFLVVFLFFSASCSVDAYQTEGVMPFSYPQKKVISQPFVESMAHASRFIVNDNKDKFYFTYYSGENSLKESIEDTDIAVCLATCNVNLNEDATRRIVLTKGEKLYNFEQSLLDSPYDPCLYQLNDTLRVWMVVSPANGTKTERSIGFRDVNINKLTLSDSVGLCKLKYSIDGNTYIDDINIKGITTLATRLRSDSVLRDIGRYPVLNGIERSGNRLFTVLTFISSQGKTSLAPCILSSLDNGRTWDLLCTLGARYDSSRLWEVDWTIVKDKMIIISRACDCAYSPCFVVDLKKGNVLLEKELFNNDVDNSRPALLYHNKRLFFIQNVFPGYDGLLRTRIRIIKTDMNINVLSQQDLVFQDGCSYISLKENDGVVYMLFTEDYRHQIPAYKGDIALTNIKEIINKL